MKPRKKPNPTSTYHQRNLKIDPQVKKWIKRLLADPEATVDDADEDVLAFVTAEVLRRRGEEFEPDEFQKKMIETCPVLAAPDRTDTATDLRHIFEQPEMQEFWKEWTGERKKHGRAPDFAAAKAVLATFGMGGVSAHVDTVYEQVKTNGAIKAIYEELEGRALERPPSIGAPPAFLHYSRVCDLFPRLAASDACRWGAMKANIKMIQALAKLYPTAGIGKRLLVDCSAIEAWCPQYSAGAKDDPAWEKREAKLRSRTPEAGFRAYTYSGSKEDVDVGDKIPVGLSKKSKAWRGYYFMVIADQATGLPLVWMLFDASIQEHHALPMLLSDLYKLWADIPAELVAGDSAFSNNASCRTCEVEYGLAPIFRLKPSEQKKKAYIPLEVGASRGGTIAYITYQGHLVCDPHRRPLPYDGFEVASRDGLKPGQTANEGAFRIRGRCDKGTTLRPQGCKRPSLRMSAKWHRLTRYPHHNNGRPELYAMRQAMLARLNQVEGIFNRLKAGLWLGASGSSRNRILDRGSLEAAFSLGCLSMTALSLASERIEHGIVVGSIKAVNQAPPNQPAQVIQMPRRAPKPLAPAAAASGTNIPLTAKRPHRRLLPASIGRRG